MANHPPSPAPLPATRTAVDPARRVLLSLGTVLLVMGVAAFVGTFLATVSARAVGGDGEGGGEVGEVKIYLLNLVEGSFFMLSVVLVAGALTAYICGAVIPRRR